RETIVQMLAEHDLTPDAQYASWAEFVASDSHFSIVVAPLSQGFGLADGTLVLTEYEVYPPHAPTTRRGRRSPQPRPEVDGGWRCMRHAPRAKASGSP